MFKIKMIIYKKYQTINVINILINITRNHKLFF